MRKLADFLPHGVILLFVCTILGIAVHHAYPFAVYALVTESSAGTWVSSMLLCTGATIALLTSMHGQKRALWLTLALTLFLLAADERFMIHEYLKNVIIFNGFEGDAKRMGKFYELPVLLAAFLGGFLSFFLFKIRQSRVKRVLLSGAVAAGIASVIFDVFRISPLIEEICKHAAELVLVIWLLEVHLRAISPSKSHL